MMKRILVTGTGGRSVGAGITRAVHTSQQNAQNKWELYTADADVFSWGIYAGVQGVILPYANNPIYIKTLQKVIDKYQIDALIPGTEAEVEVVANHLDAFEGTALIINHQTDLIPLMRNKLLLSAKLDELGLRKIETVALKEWHSIISKYTYPFIVKPTINSGGSKKVLIVFTKEEILNAIDTIDETRFKPCIQPYLGNKEEEYTVGILSDKEGNLIDSIIMKRKLIGLSLLEQRSYNGTIATISSGYSQGYIVQDRKIQEFCENISIKLKSKGPLNLQLRVAENGEIYIFEVHPRFSGTTPIRADVGFNEVDILLRNHLFNEEFGRLNFKYNVAAIRTFEHVIVPIEQMRILKENRLF